MTDTAAYWPAETIDVGDCRLTVRHAEPTVPDAEPALFVHGLGGSSLDWTQLMGLLRDRLDGVAIDLPGFGMSDPCDGHWTIASFADLVARVIETRLSGGPVHLFGNSMGGAITTRVAAIRPDLVRTLTLISPALPDLRLGRVTAAIGLAGLPLVGPPIVKRISGMPPERRLDLLIQLCFADPAAITPEMRALAVEEIRRRSSLPHASLVLGRCTRAMIKAYTDPRPDRLWRLAAKVQAPTLLVYGERDRLVHKRGARRAVRTFPNARLLVLGATGHVAQIERPETVAAAFTDHLQRVATAQSRER